MQDSSNEGQEASKQESSTIPRGSLAEPEPVQLQGRTFGKLAKTSRLEDSESEDDFDEHTKQSSNPTSQISAEHVQSEAQENAFADAQESRVVRAVQHPWTQMWDSEGNEYYHNELTGETQPEHPQESLNDAPKQVPDVQTECEVQDAVKAEEPSGAQDGENSEASPVDPVGSSTDQESTFEWWQCYDPGSRFNYYANQITGHTQWEAPEGM